MEERRMKQGLIKIEEERDYDIFWDKYVDKNNNLKEEFKNKKIDFIVIFNKYEDVDEQLLFNFYLIANKYCQMAEFTLHVHLDKNIEKKEAILFKLNHYGFLQQGKKNINSKVYFNGEIIPFWNKAINGVKRQVPVVCINNESLQFLRSGIDEEKWNKIKTSGNNELDIENNIEKIQNVIYRQCNRLLFGDVDKGGKYLSKLRKELFECEDFFDLIKGIPVLSLLIFAMSDYSFREDAAEKYKLEIKRIKGLSEDSKIMLKEEDFLYELQYKQKREKFEANKHMSVETYDNKTLWTSYKNKSIHPFIIKEVYEAIIISEGIIQLLENIVFHAGDGENDGEGLLSIYVRNFDKDRMIFEKKYEDYIKYYEKEIKNNDKEKNSSKFFVEVIIADLSGTDIPQKFMSNNLQFIKKNRSEIENRIKELGGKEGIPSEISLRSFFKPTIEESIFWSAFFSFPDKVINHYGLQIFDSIISSKRGMVEVESGNSNYNSIYEIPHIHMNHGSRYNIVCPFNATSSKDTNIYDSMFRYNYNINSNKDMLIIHLVDGYNIEFPIKQEQKEKCVNQILERIQERETFLLRLDMNTFKSTECVVKALLLHIFREKEKNEDKQFYVALLGCKTHQIINIVRMISLYYNKQGKNIKMKNVQIYIRGEKVGEEILFSGETLEDVKNNIAKCACIRGIMFDNLQAINRVLDRSGGVKDEQ